VPRCATPFISGDQTHFFHPRIAVWLTGVDGTFPCGICDGMWLQQPPVISWSRSGASMIGQELAITLVRADS
jgi:hypothetical protein